MAKSKPPAKRRLAAPQPTSTPAAPAIEAHPEPPTDLLEPTPAMDFPVVGIGASAGGLAALEAFLSAMPADTEKGVAFVIIQHLSPDHKSILTELVKRYTRMQVFEVKDGMEVKPSCAYIIPPNRDLALLNGKLQLLEPAAPRGGRHPIDFFFRSLAVDQRERAICIVLSGTGSDGTLGVRAIKGEGGMAMAQTPESTEFDGMPRSAIATGLVDYILPPADMPAQLIAYVDRIDIAARKRLPPSPPTSQESLAKIYVLLRAKTGHDFSQYKKNTIVRRVERRMALHQLELADYLRYLQQNTEEVGALFRDLLIGVTSFFRDREAFETLAAAGLPRIFDALPAGATVRIWVCGCSTGEEAYSIAILVHEYLERLQRTYKIQVFATDIDQHATDHARAGIFPASIAADVSAERLARFFTEDSADSYRIQKFIRDMLIFSEQDVLKDPPFSKLDLISCRNLLIYLNGDLQKRLMPLFHYALKPGGLLFLGNSETAGDVLGLFDIVDRKAKLYLRKVEAEGAPRPHFREPVALPVDLRTPSLPFPQAALDPSQNFRAITEQALVRYFTKSAVLVTGQGEILYFHGRTGSFLEPAPGDAGSNLLAMAREGLRRELAAALQRCVSMREPIHTSGLQVKANGHYITVDLTVLPVGSGASPELFIVTLDERPPLAVSEDGAPALSPGGAALASRVAALEHEVRAKDEYIQTIVEEMETSSEELKSSNEEMQSVNEELQSTNEELETSKEELQSVNEELAIVNAELQQKVADLSRANNDLNNLLAGTGVATLFVDHQLRVVRFTPSVTQIVNLIETDIGRPLAHIVSNLVGYDRLVADAQSVLDTLIPLEIEAQSKNGGWFLLRMRPYRTLENVIEGAVITFVDIAQRKLAERKLIESERFRRAAEMETVGIVFFQMGGPITSANNAFLHMIGHDREELEEGKINWDRITPPKWMPQSLKALEELKASGRTSPQERQYLRKDGSRGWALFAAWRIGETEAIVYVIDIAQRNAAEAGHSLN